MGKPLVRRVQTAPPNQNLHKFAGGGVLFDLCRGGVGALYIVVDFEVEKDGKGGAVFLKREEEEESIR